jgi:hypothetical protein
VKSARKDSNAEKIRVVLGNLGWDAAPKDVIEHLRREGITVTPQQVSNQKSRRAKQKKAAAEVEDLPVSVLKKVKALVDEIGSEVVRRALDELDYLTKRLYGKPRCP